MLEPPAQLHAPAARVMTQHCNSRVHSCTSTHELHAQQIRDFPVRCMISFVQSWESLQPRVSFSYEVPAQAAGSANTERAQHTNLRADRAVLAAKGQPQPSSREVPSYSSPDRPSDTIGQAYSATSLDQEHPSSQVSQARCLGALCVCLQVSEPCAAPLNCMARSRLLVLGLPLLLNSNCMQSHSSVMHKQLLYDTRDCNGVVGRRNEALPLTIMPPCVCQGQKGHAAAAEPTHASSDACPL